MSKFNAYVIVNCSVSIIIVYVKDLGVKRDRESLALVNVDIDAAIMASAKELGYDFLKEKQREAARSFFRDAILLLP